MLAAEGRVNVYVGIPGPAALICVALFLALVVWVIRLELKVQHLESMLEE